MSSIDDLTRYIEDFRVRGKAIADACTLCGACFRACPMVAPAGLGDRLAAHPEILNVPS